MTYSQPGLFELQPTFTVHSLFRLWVMDVLAALRAMPAHSVHPAFFSPPYWKVRDYGVSGQWGQEATMVEHIANLVQLFHELRRVLHPTGTAWLNYQDATAQNGRPATEAEIEACARRTIEKNYPTDQFAKANGWNRSAGTAKGSGLKVKQMLMLPQRISLAIQETGWWLRSEIVWEKSNCNSENAKDRPSRSHEMIYLFSPSSRYFYDIHAVRNNQWTSPEGWVYGSQLRTVWKTTAARSLSKAHPATFHPELPRRGVLLGTSSLGCCPECLSPVLPIYEPGPADLAAQRRCGGNSKGEYHGKGRRDYAAEGAQDPSEVKRRRLKSMVPYRLCAARTSCACLRSPDHAIPCTVLDPFSGEGTTGRAALMNGRAYVGIELHPGHAQWQIDNVAPMASLLGRLR
ncbi:hypothetical protein ABS71_10650 [bacterium SCN 62-11]|nr:MAG: hypothetical protein ABS71_10650 [bacterium SCN 62-11]